MSRYEIERCFKYWKNRNFPQTFIYLFVAFVYATLSVDMQRKVKAGCHLVALISELLFLLFIALIISVLVISELEQFIVAAS